MLFGLLLALTSQKVRVVLLPKNPGSSLEPRKTAKRLEVISADEVELRAIN